MFLFEYGDTGINNTEEETEDATEETEAEETVDETEEAVDDGDDEVVESMKALVRQNSALAEEVKTLKKQNAETKTAGDARVNELQEELDKYKAAFAKVSAVASRGKKSVAELQEQLTIKDTKIEQLNQQLTESATKDKTDIKRLQENLSTTQKESSETIKSLHEEVNKQMKLASDRTALAKRYRGLLNEAVQKYINFRASMLGVKPTDITNRLNEKYTFADIDAVCEDLLTANTNISRLPINSGRVTTRINESAKPKKTAPVNEWSYEVDDTLLELAGLKK